MHTLYRVIRFLNIPPDFCFLKLEKSSERDLTERIFSTAINLKDGLGNFSTILFSMLHFACFFLLSNTEKYPEMKQNV